MQHRRRALVGAVGEKMADDEEPSFLTGAYETLAVHDDATADQNVAAAQRYGLYDDMTKIKTTCATMRE